MILLSRLIQGFSAGGEFGTSTTFLVETAPHRKNFYGSWQIASQGAAILLASAIGFGLTNGLSEQDLQAWGWRVPFFIGLLVGPVGLWIRARMSETEEFLTRGAEDRSPVKTMATRHYGRVLAGAASVGVATLSVYLILYMPTFAVTNLGLSPLAALLGGVVAGAIALVGSPLVGRLADRVGPARVMTWTAIAALVLAWPLFQLVINVPTMPVLVAVIGVLGLIMTFYFAPLPGLMSSLFPVEVRGSGMSMAYNLGVTLLGSIAPSSSHGCWVSPGSWRRRATTTSSCR
ncbi:MFS transporter [Microbacterium sp. RD1]|uniref:MFS transporter n=1 Tax=Microbacterium sp. RD1 TaxID=3457313 RepID=UPI003FA5E744